MAEKLKVHKCLICEVRPAVERGYCRFCLSQIEADKRHKRQKKVFRYVTYQGATFAFYNGNGGTLTAQHTTRNPDKIPQGLLINLDKYCPGYTREQVKKLKRLCLGFAK